MIPVEINRWRATIGCFRASSKSLRPQSKTINPLSILFQVSKLYVFCCCFIAISIFVLPWALIMQFFAVHSLLPQVGFLPLFARMHHFARTVIYVTFELVKRIPLGFISFVWLSSTIFFSFFLHWMRYLLYLACTVAGFEDNSAEWRC